MFIESYFGCEQVSCCDTTLASQRHGWKGCEIGVNQAQLMSTLGDCGTKIETGPVNLWYVSVPILGSRQLRGVVLKIQCPGCHAFLSFLEQPPKFCSECGLNLGSTVTAVAAPGPSAVSDEMTISPGSSPVQVPDNGEGDRVGNYRLVKVLGSGGMGVVWQAVDVQTGRPVALKKLSQNHLSDDESVQRFMREARLASRMSHPRVTFVYSAGREGGQPFIAMELMPGETLSDRIKKEGPMEVGVAVDRILDVIDGLAAAHDLGLIHRDVKPSNCFMDSDDRVKVGDFGLSKSIVASDIELTRTGTFLGTPAYAAPEQIRGETLDHRTDIYAVGATLCYLLTGKPPFSGDALTVTAQIVTDVPKFQRKLPKELSRILLRGMEKNRSKRFQSLGELKNSLLPFASSQDSLANTGRRVSAYMVDTVLMIGLLVIGIVAYSIYLGIATRDMDLSFEEMTGRISQVGMFLGFLVPLCYFFASEGCFGKTLGKRLLGLKVVEVEGGGRPAFWRCLLRAFLIPGGAAIPLVAGLLLSRFWPQSLTSPVDSTLRNTVHMMVSFLPMLLILSPMFRKKGPEGFHGILSGTRVILDRRIRRGPVLEVVSEDVEQSTEQQRLGYFKLGKLLYHGGDVKVYQGLDTELNRNVWLHVNENVEVAPAEQRIMLTRTARQRWLDGGVTDGVRWDAFEAIEGLPIQAVSSSAKVGWEEYRRMMIDVAEELKAAHADGTMPGYLSLPQVWMDRTGHAKLIDKNMVDVVSSGRDADPLGLSSQQSVSGPGSAVRLVKNLADHLVRTRKDLPLSAQQFLAGLKQQPDKIETLDHTIESLRSMDGRLEKIGWDTRVGILGITVGMEYMLFATISSFAFLLSFFLLPLPEVSRFCFAIVLSLVAPMALGVFLRGGLVFHLMGVTVANRKGGQAGWFKLLCRSFIAWAPAMILVICTSMIGLAGAAGPGGELPVEASVVEHMEIAKAWFPWLLIGTLASQFFAFMGILVSLFKPTRGLQDILMGTRLVPK